MKPYFETDIGKIYLGNCCELLSQLGHFDILFTDIPFGVDLSYKEYKDSRKAEIYRQNCEDWFSAMKGVADLYIVKVPTKNLHIVLPEFSRHLNYTWPIMQYSPNATTHGPFNLSLFTMYLIAIEGKVRQRPSVDVFTNTVNKLRRTGHPAEMPVQPVITLLNMFGANEETTVLDPFLGSGTTAEACERQRIPWVGIDMTEEYCAMAAKRVKAESEITRWEDLIINKKDKRARAAQDVVNLFSED